MPLYEYKCQNCGETFELLRSFSDSDDDVVCPYCEAQAAERQISVPSCSFGGADSCSTFT